MILIRFTDTQAERRALGYLAGRFPFKTWAGGETLVPESALASLAVAGITFTVVGPPTYEQNVPTMNQGSRIVRPAHRVGAAAAGRKTVLGGAAARTS